MLKIFNNKFYIFEEKLSNLLLNILILLGWVVMVKWKGKDFFIFWVLEVDDWLQALLVADITKYQNVHLG